MFITASFSFVQDLCRGHCLQSLAPHSAAMAQTLLLEQSRQTSGYAACLGEEFRPALHDPKPLPESLLLPKAYRILCTLLNWVCRVFPSPVLACFHPHPDMRATPLSNTHTL